MRELTWTHGANLQPDGTTHFSLWAPQANTVHVRLGSGSVHVMETNEAGWYSISLHCGAGTLYEYIIDNNSPVPDPASRSQPHGIEGLSCVIDHRAYAWGNTDWQGRPWHETVIYELHAGAFGGFDGVRQRIPALRELGVTALELMPVSEFPGERNWGYDGVFPFAPQSTYGSPDDLKRLIDSCHAHGIMVFMDVVYNHFGPHGNYLHQYADSFFDRNAPTPWGPAIDFSQAPVRDFFCENALMWLMDYRVDGLRLDAVHAILDSGFLSELAQRVHQAVQPARHVHLMLENERNQASLLSDAYTAQWNDDGHHALHVLLTGEQESYYADFAQEPTTKLSRCLKEGFIYQGQRNSSGRPRGEPSGHLPPTSFILFLQNHDQIGNRALGERLTVLADHCAIRAALSLLLLGPMIPLLFMGEEWGCEQPFLYFTDHPPELARAVREGRRQEFSEFPAFSDESRRQMIPDPNERSTFLASVPDESAGNDVLQEQWRAFYKHLLHLRQTEISPRLPGTVSEAVHILGDKAVSASWRMGDNSRLRIDINLCDTAINTTPPTPEETIIHAYRAHLSKSLSLLPPYSARVILGSSL